MKQGLSVVAGELPQPPYDRQVMANGHPFTLRLQQIYQSDTWALATPDMRPWLLMVWAVSWDQRPCGSLPSDEKMIALRLGQTEQWLRAHRDILLRGWRRHQDGRLYHDTITELVLDMLGRRRSEALKKRRQRNQQDTKNVPRESPGSPPGVPGESPYGKGEGKGKGEEEVSSLSQDSGSGGLSNFTNIGSSAKNADEPPPKVSSTKKQKNGYPDAFERLWGKRPHRAGSDPKAGAFRAWNARRKEGNTEEDMESGTDRYRVYCQKTGKLGTEFVMQLATFLGPEDPPRFLEGWEAPREPVKLTWEERAAAVGLSARGGETWPQFQARIEQAERKRP